METKANQNLNITCQLVTCPVDGYVPILKRKLLGGMFPLDIFYLYFNILKF